jgi:hypothetical protein
MTQVLEDLPSKPHYHQKRKKKVDVYQVWVGERNTYPDLPRKKVLPLIYLSKDILSFSYDA